MDMDMGMGGHHMSNPAMGYEYNYAFARDYWYILAGVIGSLAVARGVNYYGAMQRRKMCRDPSVENPTRPNGLFSQAWATATAITREMGHPQYYASLKGFRWATPPPLGRILVILSYWAMIIYFMTWNAIKHDTFFWERIGYRNAWITITQLPFLYLLSMKFNPVGFLIGSSHERLNWLHRWVARTMFVTATVHGFHFWTEWVLAEFVEYELRVMPLVKYGLGAWGILLWSVITGFVPIRRLSYEIWVAQHALSAIIMLWLLHVHIPANARYLLWMSISFLVFDRAARWVLLFWHNVRWKASSKSCCSGRRHLGHKVLARAVGDSTTVVTIKDVQFKWSAGQHIYLWIPRLGPIEAHPYTIACAHRIKGTCCCNSVQLIIRSHKGFSKRLYDYATKNPQGSLTGFLSGPYGAPPRWDIYETMVLIGASTGASFTIPILESMAACQEATCAKRIEVALLAKTTNEIEYYAERTKVAAQAIRNKGVDVRIHVAITGSQAEKRESGIPLMPQLLEQSGRESDSSSIDSTEKVKAHNVRETEDTVETTSHDCPCASSSSSSGQPDPSIIIKEYTTRPDIEALIREPVEQAWGETAVVVCGGREVVARTRNCVSQISDERAVHKGSGAQGIYLHVEEYSF